MLNYVVYIALAGAFTILLSGKLGFTEYVQMHTVSPIANLFRCVFCLAFWISVVMSIILYIFADTGLCVLLCPVFTTPLIRFLV